MTFTICMFPLQEVIKLVKDGRLTPDSQACRSVGYRQALDYLQATWGFPTYKDGQILCPAMLKVPYVCILCIIHNWMTCSYRSYKLMLAFMTDLLLN